MVKMKLSRGRTEAEPVSDDEGEFGKMGALEFWR